MVLGIGVDIVEVGRIRHAVERYGGRFVRRIFTQGEADYCRRGARPAERFAARFAAKEAAMKALGVGWRKGIRFVDVEVRNNELGAPGVVFTGRALELSRELGVERIHVSLSHHRNLAIAQVLLEGAADGHQGRPPDPGPAE